MKLHKCGELAFIPGVLLLGLATVLMSKASFGLSMVVSPAYVLADWIRVIPTGSMCYIYQGLLVIVTSMVMGRFKISYLITFFSAVCFGLSVDAFGAVFAFIQSPSIVWRVILFAVAIPINSLSISSLASSSLMCVYVSRVTDTSACPMIYCNIFGFIPLFA